MAIFRKIDCGCIVFNIQSDAKTYPNGEIVPDDCRLYVVVQACDDDSDGLTCHLRPFPLDQTADSTTLDVEEEQALLQKVAGQLYDGDALTQIRKLLR